MAVTRGFQGRTFDVPQTGVPCIDLPSGAPCVAADAVFADAKAFLSSSEARQMSESELERELHRRGQESEHDSGGDVPSVFSAVVELVEPLLDAEHAVHEGGRLRRLPSPCSTVT